MDLRTRTALFCAALALAIAASVLLRGRVRQVQALFAGFSLTVALWYLSQALFAFYRFTSWERATALLAVLMPQLAVRLFTAIVPPAGTAAMTRGPEPEPPAQSPRFVRVASLCGLGMAALVLSPYQGHDAVRVALFVYVGGLTSAGLFSLWSSGRSSTSRAVRVLVAVGAFATAFSLADVLWFVGARLPPIGAVLSIVFLFVLSQSLQSTRLLDLYDLAGRLLVATALAFCIAAIFWIFVTLVGRFNTMYLNAVLASIQRLTPS
jgi:hypothetical protein